MLSRLLFFSFFIITTSTQLFRVIGVTSEVSIIALIVSKIGSRLNKYQLLIAIFILLAFFSSLFFTLIKGDEFKLGSFIVALLTMVAISLTNLKLLYDCRRFVLKYAVITVYFSIALATVETFFFQIFESRTNVVLFLNRLTFLFDEPSHYAIFLALVLHLIVYDEDSKFDITVLSIGLLLTWSLSGFILFSLLYAYKNFFKFNKKTLKLFLVFFLCLASFIYIWNSYIVYTDFWIVHKIHSVQLLLQGNNSVSSAMVRSTSVYMHFIFLQESYFKEDFYSIFFGVGFGNINEWVTNFYKANFSIITITEVNNFISSVVIQNGLFGILMFSLAFFSCSLSCKVYSPRFLDFVFVMLSLSFFSGNAFGSIALINFYLCLLVSVRMKIEYRRLNK
ncbi:hypothetical protein ACE02S_15340 [Shewanella xiamenensis]|uniref:hypothetical protein n=1 Tax=Shewanella xiamenensis TaxID=332186 RepID=UPI0035B9AF10